MENAAQQINALAQETNVLVLPAYIPIKALDLANESKKITESLKTLESGDSVTFQSNEGDVAVPLEIVITQDDITNLFSERSISNEVERILMVRRPDFLGETKWDFRFEKRSLSAKVADTAWLAEFHAAKVDVRPGDALRVKIKETTAYDKRGEVIKEEIEVVKVLEIIRMPEQLSLL